MKYRSDIEPSNLVTLEFKESEWYAGRVGVTVTFYNLDGEGKKTEAVTCPVNKLLVKPGDTLHLPLYNMPPFEDLRWSLGSTIGDRDNGKEVKDG